MAVVELAVGLGLRPGTPADRILGALRDVLGAKRIGCLATIDRRVDEPGLRAVAAELEIPVLGFDSVDLDRVSVPHRAAGTRAAVGTGSVAEAAAILAGGGSLVIVRRTVGGVVVAAAEVRG